MTEGAALGPAVSGFGLEFGLDYGGQCRASFTAKLEAGDALAPRERSPMYIGLGTIVVIVVIVLLILFLRR